jgi:hypothetical protein
MDIKELLKLLKEYNGKVYEAFLHQGNIKACICGHDHDSNYWGKYIPEFYLYLMEAF